MKPRQNGRGLPRSRSGTDPAALDVTGHRRLDSVDALLVDLAAALDVTPSADFSARVRARIPEATPASGWAWRWGFIAGAFATVALLLVFMRVNADWPLTASPDTRAEATAAPGSLAYSGGVATLAAPPAVVATPSRERERTPIAPVRSTTRLPRVLVAPDQAAAFRHLMDRIARGDVVLTNVAGTGTELAPIEISELAPIPQIVIPPLDAPPNAGGAGSRK